MKLPSSVRTLGRLHQEVGLPYKLINYHRWPKLNKVITKLIWYVLIKSDTQNRTEVNSVTGLKTQDTEEAGRVRCKLPAKPLPISNPFVAGRDIAAFASSASSLSNTGEPNPCPESNSVMIFRTYYSLLRHSLWRTYANRVCTGEEGNTKATYQRDAI